MSDRQQKIREELDQYGEVEKVHDLPRIFSSWTAGFVVPKLKSLGYGSFDDLWLDAARAVAQRKPGQPLRFVSIGAGNCDVEAGLAERFVAAGIEDFTFECLELNPKMLARGRALAAEKGLLGRMAFTECDLNEWRPSGPIDLAFANHSLHHMVALEALFDGIAAALTPEGAFLVHDMIGRNGHMRWPEALRLVHAIWRTMPDRYKYNHQLRRTEELYVNWDCSASGFEGIRAQDILPLLLERFSFEVFLSYGNLVDVFIDRGFGPNFDPDRPEDLDFVNQISLLDEAATELGIVKPTKVSAILRPKAVATTLRCYRHWTPEFCVRPTDIADLSEAAPAPAVQPTPPVERGDERPTPKIVGAARFVAPALGYWPDGWCEEQTRLTIESVAPIGMLTLHGWRPADAVPGVLEVLRDGLPIATVAVGAGELELSAPIAMAAGQQVSLRIRCTGTGTDHGPDRRHLAFVLRLFVAAPSTLAEGTG